ncbi:DNA-binding protein [Aliiglaciecola sp. CAU 1673]|uniref:DNA-binding protein n=1 Tax=Aliiglaciecola sp. CAU 1673 TaxID=3032595 RepID=UPI0023D9D762|nr:DNA-binding protein [Aliiglaciecola sp. CAU 1673]MDF2177930.1 DNA-binding protein [Aliiglaciecola sp. CAU 1673]
MARHPDVAEKAIIQAGLELEGLGKTPNPGAIRAHLGYRGGLLRIKAIWEAFNAKRQQELLPKTHQELGFDALPDDYAGQASQLMSRVSEALEQLAIEAYSKSQQLFEKRIKAMDKAHQEKLSYLQECEQAADQSITRLESELADTQQELQQLADQNAKLLIENSELRGRLSVYENRNPKHKTAPQPQEIKQNA